MMLLVVGLLVVVAEGEEEEEKGRLWRLTLLGPVMSLIILVGAVEEEQGDRLVVCRVGPGKEGCLVDRGRTDELKLWEASTVYGWVQGPMCVLKRS